MTTEFQRIATLSGMKAFAVAKAKEGYTLYDVSIYDENNRASYRPGFILICDGKPDLHMRWYAINPEDDGVTVDYFGKRARVEARDAGLAMMATIQAAIDTALNPNEIDATEYKIARRLIEQATDEGYTVTVDDGGAIALERSSDVNAILAVMGTTGSDTLFLYNADGTRIGSVWLVYGNGTDLVSDYSAKDGAALDALAEWLQPINDYADELAGY